MYDISENIYINNVYQYHTPKLDKHSLFLIEFLDTSVYVIFLYISISILSARCSIFWSVGRTVLCVGFVARSPHGLVRPCVLGWLLVI